MIWWMVRRHLRATWESVVRCRRFIKECMRMEAVARELLPRVRRVARWWGFGGVDGAWEVVRRTATWRERVFGFVRSASFDSETLSLMVPMISFMVFDYYGNIDKSTIDGFNRYMSLEREREGLTIWCQIGRR
ncbi:hypothetical protein HanIR_Chr07g0313771 [Helianthus annuus]|nr:hypothetical protein HanIR_Chr07g0313771 [Helianthus annuus]